MIKLLLIDDENLIIQVLTDFLEDLDFDICSANNGKEGLEVLKQENPDLVIVDLNMPVMDGFEFIQRAQENYSDVPIIVLSAIGVLDKAMDAVRVGAWDFISKPVSDMQIVHHTINKCLEKSQLIRENQLYQSHLEQLVEKRTLQLLKSKRQIINCLGRAAEFKDNETGNHVLRVSHMCDVLSKGLGLDDEFRNLIKDAAPMHDVGKIGIKDSILLKAGKLDEREWEHMKKHVIFGCQILSSNEDDLTDLPLLAQDERRDVVTIAKKIALFHHERWDGKGYFYGLEKEEIPLEARIVSLIDVYDAVSSKRPYKEAFPEEKCRQIIKEGAGTQFDPDIVSVFFDHINEISMASSLFVDH